MQHYLNGHRTWKNFLQMLTKEKLNKDVITLDARISPKVCGHPFCMHFFEHIFCDFPNIFAYPGFCDCLNTFAYFCDCFVVPLKRPVFASNPFEACDNKEK